MPPAVRSAPSGPISPPAPPGRSPPPTPMRSPSPAKAQRTPPRRAPPPPANTGQTPPAARDAQPVAAEGIPHLQVLPATAQHGDLVLVRHVPPSGRDAAQHRGGGPARDRKSTRLTP